jgi:hypothetical protein
MLIKMQVRAAQMPDEALQQFTLEMMRTINAETDAQAALPPAPAGQGTRGDAVTIGQIVLTALTSGTVVALFGVLKAYFERKPSLEIGFKRPGGVDFKITASQLGKDQIDQTIALARNFFETNDG